MYLLHGIQPNVWFKNWSCDLWKHCHVERAWMCTWIVVGPPSICTSFHVTQHVFFCFEFRPTLGHHVWVTRLSPSLVNQCSSTPSSRQPSHAKELEGRVRVRWTLSRFLSDLRGFEQWFGTCWATNFPRWGDWFCSFLGLLGLYWFVWVPLASTGFNWCWLLATTCPHCWSHASL